MENCPYCDEAIEIDHDDGYGYEEDEIFEQECKHCNKVFKYNTDIIYVYTLDKAPCLNGEAHDWKPRRGAPAYYFEGKELCNCCGEERDTLSKEERKLMVEKAESEGE